MTVCAMALHDLLLINRWLLPRLTGERRPAPFETFYLARVASAHLLEAATFLRKSEPISEIEEFIKRLDREAQAAYRALLKIGDGGSGQFYEQLKHARNKSFHY